MGESSSEYVPMTTEESWMLIRNTHERVRSVHQSIAKHAQERAQQQQQQQNQNQQSNITSNSSSKPNYFGWQIEYHTQGGVLLFAFEKPFYHVTALQAMEQMWTTELSMNSYRSAPDVANQTLEIVQHLNEDTYVFQRRLLDHSTASSAAPKYIKTTYIRFRLKTAHGYLIGLKTIDKKDGSSATMKDLSSEDEEQGGLSWAVNLCVWTEFIQDHSPYGGHEFCVARLSGFTNLQSEELNCRLVVNMIIQLLRWENLNIGPVITLSSD